MRNAHPPPFPQIPHLISKPRPKEPTLPVPIESRGGLRPRAPGNILYAELWRGSVLPASPRAGNIPLRIRHIPQSLWSNSPVLRRSRRYFRQSAAADRPLFAFCAVAPNPMSPPFRQTASAFEKRRHIVSKSPVSDVRVTGVARKSSHVSRRDHSQIKRSGMSQPYPKRRTHAQIANALPLRRMRL